MTSDVWSQEQLSHVESIRQLKARYFRLMDMKLWNQMSEVFALDIACDYRGAGTDPVTGFSAVLDATEAILRGFPAAVAALMGGSARDRHRPRRA